MGSVLLIVLAIFVGLLLLVAFWAIALYNGLIGKRNRFRNAFAQIEMELVSWARRCVSETGVHEPRKRHP